jgi:hypothetical protein
MLCISFVKDTWKSADPQLLGEFPGLSFRYPPLVESHLLEASAIYAHGSV